MNGVTGRPRKGAGSLRSGLFDERSVAKKRLEMSVAEDFSPIIGRYGITPESVAILRSTSFFDESFYRTQLRPSFGEVRNLLLHYLSEGWLVGLRPNKVFDPSWYQLRYNDILANGLEPLSHFVLHGIREGWRYPTPWLSGRVTIGQLPRRPRLLHYPRTNIDRIVAIDHPYYRMFLEDKMPSYVVVFDEDTLFAKVENVARQIHKEDPSCRILLLFVSLKGEHHFDLSYLSNFQLCKSLNFAQKTQVEMQKDIAELLQLSDFDHIVYLAGDDELFGMFYDCAGHCRISRSSFEWCSPKSIVNGAVAKKKIPVYFLHPDWTTSGVNTFTAELCAQLLSNKKYAPEIIITNSIETRQRRFMPNVPVRMFQTPANAEDVWKQVDQLFEDGDQCIVIPNYDFVAAATTANFPEHVKVVGIAHSDDKYHYEQVYRLGRYWNWIVAVSDEIANNIRKLNPVFSDKISRIYYGITPTLDEEEFEESVEVRQEQITRGEPIQLVYAGRLVEYQKCASRLSKLIQCLDEIKLPYKFNILGDGPVRSELVDSLHDHIQSGLVTFHGRLSSAGARALAVRSHASILVSDFEGLPLSTLEAISGGAVPCMYRIESGIEEVLEADSSCVLADQQDARSLAKGIAQLSEGLNYLRFACNAYERFQFNQLDVESMTAQYVRVFDKILSARPGEFERPPPLIWGHHSIAGRVPPPSMFREN